MNERSHWLRRRGRTIELYVIARTAKPIATARQRKAIAVIARELQSIATATTTKTEAATTHITAGFFVGGAACFHSAASCDAVLSAFAGSPVW